MAIWNGTLWALGNGLASTTLIVYLARELHSERLGLGIGLILAAPQFAGLLRVIAPALIRGQAGRKVFCIAMFLLSAVTLLALPWTCEPGQLPTPGWSLAALVVLWCIYHLLQYLGMVALWAWLGDMARPKVRGRFFGRRERWMMAATAIAAVGAGLFVWYAAKLWPAWPGSWPYAIMATIGGLLMLLAIVPLVLASGLQESGSVLNDTTRLHSPPTVSKSLTATRRGLALSQILRPFRDRNFLAFALFGCWFSFFNGITQSAQDYFSMQVLGISLLTSQTLKTGMRLGQCGASPWLGTLADRFGNRTVMIACQCIVAAGLAFFAIATPTQWYWVAGAWLLWIAYAGINIAIPSLTLKLAPPGDAAAYVATFEGVRGVFFAASTVLGGFLVDHYKADTSTMFGTGLSFFAAMFLFGAVMRGLGAVLLLPVREPPTGETAVR